MRNIRRLFKNKRGFTLVELIVVIAIMAVLTAIITPILTKSNDSSTKDKYKQYCLSIMESADSICDAYNKGAKKVAGFDIVNSKGEIAWSAIRDCLSTDNIYNYQYNVAVAYPSGCPTGLSEGGATITNAYTQKDTIVVYFKTKNVTGELYAVGCWYFEANKTEAKYKYDYVSNAIIDKNKTFYNPNS